MAVFFLVLIPILIFSSISTFDFVNWNDNSFIYNNPQIKSISLETVSQWFARPQIKLFAPLTALSYALDYQNYGLQAGGYHITSLAFHLLNILLVFYLLTFVSPNTFFAFLGALLFGIHPAQVETVVWLSERKTLLSAFFSLAAFALFITRHYEKRKQNWPLLALLFTAALLSKVTTAMLPPAWMGWESASAPFQNYALYLTRALCPSGLDLFYFEEQIAAFLSLIPFLKIIPGIIFLAAVIYGMIKKKEWGFWLFWFFFWLVPAATIFKIPAEDHYLYLPLIGLIAFLMTVLARYRLVLPVLLMAANLLCIPITLSKIPAWKNGETLGFSFLRKNPSDYRALVQLADYYQERGRLTKALELYQMLAARFPGETYPHITLVNLCLATGLTEKAAAALKIFEQRHAGKPEFAVLQAALVETQGNSALALELLKQAEAKNPDNPAVLLNLGKLYFRAGNFDLAIASFQKALRRNELDAEGNYFLGLSFMAMKQWETAARQFETMLRKGMYHRGVYFQQGYAYLKTGQKTKAEACYFKSIESDPSLHEAFYHLGLLKLQERKPEEAQVYLAQAVALKPEETYRKMLDFAQREKQSASTQTA